MANPGPLPFSFAPQGEFFGVPNGGAGFAFSHGLLTPPEMDCSFDFGMAMTGITQLPSGEGAGYHKAPSSHSMSKSSTQSSKQSRASKSGGRRSDHGQGEEEEDQEGTNYPNYRPSTHNRGKAKSSSSSDFACWFFKLDPVRYAECMHVHGRSSDLKYAHLKHHFQDREVPAEFDKNMSWDEVWTTLFPQTPPPNSKHYVMNEMIMSILESTSIAGDDVTRFLDAFENAATREAVMARIYGLSRDRGSSPGLTSKSTRRKRQTLQIPGFDRIPRVTERGSIITPPSSSSSGSMSLPAFSSRPSHRYSPSGSAYHHELNLTIDTTHGADPYTTFSSTGTPLSPSSAHSPDVRKVFILDEQYNPLWFEQELPWSSWFDFESYYLSHACNKSGREEAVQIGDFAELQEEFELHKAGEIGGSCHFTLFAIQRS
ncbi:hypothetical protein AA313_de0202566 [Arthrobotrys entomopaga]|nr:hypothetical protein AA313_de0202566 [Arthrobotrys entomopaga]